MRRIKENRVLLIAYHEIIFCPSQIPVVKQTAKPRPVQQSTNKAHSICAESTNKGVNQRSEDVT